MGVTKAEDALSGMAMEAPDAAEVALASAATPLPVKSKRRQRKEDEMIAVDESLTKKSKK